MDRAAHLRERWEVQVSQRPSHRIPACPRAAVAGCRSTVAQRLHLGGLIWGAGMEVSHPREGSGGAHSQLGRPAGPIRQVSARPRAFPRWSDGSLLNFVSWAPGKPRPINKDKKCVYMTASRGEGQDPAVPGLWRGWDTPMPVQWGGHACPVPPHRGLGGPEVHDGAALHLQAEQRDGRKAFPPAAARSHERGLSPWLVSLPQQGTVGRRGDGRPPPGLPPAPPRWRGGG